MLVDGVHVLLSLDEAWLDVTENFQQIPSATWIAQRIKQHVRTELRLTCSAGVSFNKFLAKIASDEDKPDGLFIITPQSAPEFLYNLAVRKIPGVGKVTQAKLKKLGIEYGHQLLEQPEHVLVEHFGKMGDSMYAIIRGHDDQPVVSRRECKSVSAENTFAADFLYGAELQEELRQICAELIKRLEKKSLSGKTLTLKIKFHDFQQITRSITQFQDFQTEPEIFAAAHEKLCIACIDEFPHKPIRLLGVGISNFSRENTEATDKPRQLELFPTRYFYTEKFLTTDSAGSADF